MNAPANSGCEKNERKLYSELNQAGELTRDNMWILCTDRVPLVPKGRLLGDSSAALCKSPRQKSGGWPVHPPLPQEVSDVRSYKQQFDVMPGSGRNDRSPRYFVVHPDPHEFRNGIDP
jgi:hypothetical protein